MTYLLNSTPQQIEILTHTSQLLHLFHHRNKNQHRSTPWYRNLCTFRRHLSRLLSCYNSLLVPATSFSAKHKKKIIDAETRVTIAEELGFWTNVLVRKWYTAFSQLAVDLRFGVLGVFLLGALGEVCAVTGVSGELDRRGEEEIVKAIETFGAEWAEGQEDGAMRLERDEGTVVQRNREDGDLGEVVQRSGDGEARVGEKRSRGVSSEVMAKEAKVKKRKKKGGNAIDDLFGSL